LEDGFWNALREIAIVENVPMSKLVVRIDQKRRRTNLSSAVRLFILDFYRKETNDLKTSFLLSLLCS
jgi:predicted DNA-binding ribbon-helix-helix protein